MEENIKIKMTSNSLSPLRDMNHSYTSKYSHSEKRVQSELQTLDKCHEMVHNENTINDYYSILLNKYKNVKK